LRGTVRSEPWIINVEISTQSSYRISRKIGPHLLSPGPTGHTPWASTSMCGEDEPPREEHATTCGGASLHLRRKLRTSLPREEYATACDSVPLCLRRMQQTQPLARGPGPTSHIPWAPVPGCREVKPPLAPVPRLLGVAAEYGKVKFSKPNAAVSRHPAHGLAKPSSVKVTCQSAAGTGVTVGVTEGGLAVITAASTQKQRANRQSNFGPTYRLVYSPEAGLGATVDTLNQGYPLLQCEDTVPMQLSLAAW
jgi:hypothetical protein